jgi:hypothetical protein
MNYLKMNLRSRIYPSDLIVLDELSENKKQVQILELDIK